MVDVLPPTVEVSFDQSVLDYTRARLRQHTLDSYAGISMSKFPEDLRVYEHLLWLSKTDVVIELGVQFGASSLWFRDRLQTLGRYRSTSQKMVIGIDIDLTAARAALAGADPEYEADIKLIEGSVTDRRIPELISDLIPAGSQCLVIEDSAHTYESTLASLRGFSRFVQPAGFIVVEDGSVDIDELRVFDDWPRGVLPALHYWLENEGAGFEVRHDLQLYGVTCHPGGVLQRTN